MPLAPVQMSVDPSAPQNRTTEACPSAAAPNRCNSVIVSTSHSATECAYATASNDPSSDQAACRGTSPRWLNEDRHRHEPGLSAPSCKAQDGPIGLPDDDLPRTYAQILRSGSLATVTRSGVGAVREVKAMESSRAEPWGRSTRVSMVKLS